MSVRKNLGVEISYEELREYIEAFKGSSDRARHVLIAVLTVSLLMAVVNYNLLPSSWPMTRSREILEYGWLGPESERRGDQINLEDSPLSGEWLTALEPLEDRVSKVSRDEEVLKKIREIYLEQFIEHAIVVDSPIPGLWIDVNDLGTVGGAILLLLMVALVYYLAREHENLYLSLYRVRSLCSDPNHESGDSPANFLYHALAMRQALSFPPTLARWRRRWWFFSLNVIFFFPFVIYVWVVVYNFLSAVEREPVIGTYDVAPMRILALHVALALVLLGLSVAAALHSKSMAVRWEEAFFHVNPGRRHAPQMTIVEWFSLRRRPKKDRFEVERLKMERRLMSQMTDTIRKWPAPTNGEKVSFVVQASLKPRLESHIDSETRDKMVALLFAGAERLAKIDCREKGRESVELIGCECVQNDWKATEWVVAARFNYSCRLK